MTEPESLSDPRITGLTIRECGEPLVDLHTMPAIRLADARSTWVRLSIADRLITAQTLLPRGLRLLVIEGPQPSGPPRRCCAQSHATGAAVDLTLCTDDAAELNLETPTNRATLHTALTTTGFVNYPAEWRHWSFGDRYWAFATGAPAALYGPTNPKTA